MPVEPLPAAVTSIGVPQRSSQPSVRDFPPQKYDTRPTSCTAVSTTFFRSGSRSSGRFSSNSIASSCEMVSEPMGIFKLPRFSSRMSSASFWYLVKLYSIRICSAVLAVIVMVSAIPVWPSSTSSSGSLSGTSTVCVAVVISHISQKTCRSSSTRSSSSVNTSTPSPAPAVLDANTATTSRQSGACPTI